MNEALIEVNFAWDNMFLRDMQNRFKDVQRFVDSECIRLMTPYTPMLTGFLFKTPSLTTQIGTGNIEYIGCIYARFQYYGKVMVSPITGSSWAMKGEKKVLTGRDLTYNKSQHPLAGAFWFERMKKAYGDEILRGAGKIAGAKVIWQNS